MDSEAIYKKFVLRVMAARSPSVRFRKALYKKDFSVDPKCPNTVPAKPSRSRVSRLAMISSIPHKAMRPKEAKAISTNKNATPNTKALTELKKPMQSPAAFRSAQNPVTARTRPRENRVVAKALVFHSPKKLVKLKRSVELSSSMKKLCNGMRKLMIENKRNGLRVNDNVGTSTPSKKPPRRREVKSREFDSVRSLKQIDEKAKCSGTLKRRVKEKIAHEAKVKELENQSFRCESSVPRSEKTCGDEELLVENKYEELSDTLKTNIKMREDPAVITESGLDTSKQYQNGEIEGKENALALEKENATIAADVDREDTCVSKESKLEKAKQYETTEIKKKENVLALKYDGNATSAADVDEESDDKENSSALDNNRKIEQATLLKKKVCKAMTIADKCFNGKSVASNNRVKYTKPKLTNPKPFRLRTDERRILKEAKTERKPQSALAKEEETTNMFGFHSENIGPKHQPVRLEKKNTTSRLKAFRGTSTTLVRQDASEDMVNGKRVASGTKKKVTSKTTETMEEASRMNGESKEVAIMHKPSVCAVASGEKRPPTVPKGPNFHSIHVPKTCTKRAASKV